VQNFVQSLASAVTRYDASRRNTPAVATAPVATAAMPAAAASDAGVPAGPPGLHPGILGTVGEELAQDLTRVLGLIAHAAANPKSYGDDLQWSYFLVEELRRKAKGMQQIARLTQNQVRQSHEKLALHHVAQSVLDERKSEYSANGLIINTRFKPVEIIVDPGLLVSLIMSALDWVTEFGSVVRMGSSMKNWPQHGLLTFQAAQGVRTQLDADHKSAVSQSIAWHLLQHTAQSMGVGLEMNDTLTERSLTIEFPRTVVALEGMTMVEMDAGPGNDSFGSVNSNFIAGHQVLVISADYNFFQQVREVCKGLSLHCDQAPNVQMAERMCEQRVPHLIVCEESLANDRYDLLLEELQRHSPGFPTIIVDDGIHGFELSGWSSDSKSRISRKEVAEQLPSALTIELSRSI
jgi:hypothetical protein